VKVPAQQLQQHPVKGNFQDREVLFAANIITERSIQAAANDPCRQNLESTSLT
jgi:hypothetical protein